MKIVDARGLACPQPLIETKKMLDSLTEPCQVEVLVDNDIAVCNVQDYLLQLGIESNADGYKISFTSKDHVETSSALISCPTGGVAADWTLVINTTSMGKGSQELGGILLKAFINTLPQTSSLPSHILMYNEGVYCATAQQGVLDTLRELENIGVTIIVCGTCVEYYGIKESVEVGIISNMLKIIEIKQAASKLVYL